MTQAHDQRLTLELIAHYPEHPVRKSDPHYAIFNAAKRRMKKLDLWKCTISGCKQPGPLELHHDKVEYSLQGGVDIAKFNELYGLHLADDEQFRQFIEGPGNLEILCPVHHRGAPGVHILPTPFWNALRVWRDDLQPPAEAT